MEIEIKAKFDNKKIIESRLRELGAIEEKQKHQIDEYYNHPARDTRKTNEYIRLRYKPGAQEGIFAYHVNISDGVNKEHEVNVGDIAMFKQILAGFNFPLLGTIDKQRKVYSLDGLKITLDEVKDIGNFVEIEAEGNEAEIEQKKAECINMLKKIGLSKENLCKGIWLCDIATGRSKL